MTATSSFRLEKPGQPGTGRGRRPAGQHGGHSQGDGRGDPQPANAYHRVTLRG